MKTFKDATDQTWNVEMNINAVKRVRSLLDIDLLGLDQGDPPLITRIGIDVMLLCDMIFCLVKPQADERGISDEDFGNLLGGDSILRAQSAFYEELVDFFRGLGRTDLAQALNLQQEMILKAVEVAEQRMGMIVPSEVVDEILNRSLEGITGKQSTSLPECLALTPDPSPSEN